MADVQWVFVERSQGRMRRVTVLDRDLGIVSTHVSELNEGDHDADEVQLLCAAEFAQRPVAVPGPLRRAIVD